MGETNTTWDASIFYFWWHQLLPKLAITQPYQISMPTIKTYIPTTTINISSTLLSMCVIGLGTTLGVVKTVQILHQLQQLGLPSAQPKTQRRSVLTTALRQIMECMLRVVVRTLTASALLGKDIFTNALLTQSSILRRDFVTLRVY